MKYYVYIIQSQKDNSFYIGYTSNIEKRLYEHNHGSTRYTSGLRPWKLVYKEEFLTKTEALKREKFLKKQRNRKFYETLIGKNERTK